MSLTPEQKQAVASWVAAGDNLSLVQKKLTEQFKVSMTYMDVRFLVDDLGRPTPPPQPAGDEYTAGADEIPPASEEANLPAEDDALPSTSTLTLEVDRIMRPGTVVSGTVTFSDGISGKWALDQQGRLMLDTPQKGYQPSPADVQTFQRELQAQLQRQGY
ncbi:MAG: hypothetical protein EBT62_04750 [Opitutaceae bacterium]|nr:hypothetical protein [Opitutaceae bacterium]